jgi:hypothetical protein
MATDLVYPPTPGWIFPPNPGPKTHLKPFSIDPRIGTPSQPQPGQFVLVREKMDNNRLKIFFARIEKIGPWDQIKIYKSIRSENKYFKYWEIGTPDPTVIPEGYYHNPIQVPANVSWIFPPNPGPRRTPTTFHVDPRMGTPGAPRVGELVRLRGVGFEADGRDHGPPNTGYGHIIGLGPPFPPESIIVRVEIRRQPIGGSWPVIFDYWNVGTIAQGSQLMLEQLFRQKRQLPTNMASIIGKFAGTSNPNRIPISDQAGYKTGSSITNERPVINTSSNEKIASVLQKNENAPKGKKGLSWLFGSLFGGRKRTRKHKQNRRKTRKN